jgi:hypothetical protein
MAKVQCLPTLGISGNWHGELASDSGDMVCCMSWTPTKNTQRVSTEKNVRLPLETMQNSKGEDALWVNEDKTAELDLQ